jgi:4,5-DOPA dioxygenase extradiol
MINSIETLMPVLFIGHGSPMNVVQDNDFTKSLSSLAAQIPTPQAILVISAHWLTYGTYVSGAERLEQIYDFYGFPEALYQIRYEPQGCPALAETILKLAPDGAISIDATRGIDHGAWTVLKHIYPQCDIPVVQLSLDVNKSEQAHVELGRSLVPLRRQGVLIIGSGNVVHNLGRMSYEQDDRYPYVWVYEFDSFVQQAIAENRIEDLVAYQRKLGNTAKLAVPTNDHYLPLLYTESVRQPGDVVRVIHEGIQHKSISMRSYMLMQPSISS